MSDVPDTKLSLESQNPLGERLKALQGLIPEAFTEDHVDFEKLRSALGDVVETRAERYGLTWAGKSEAIRAVQIPSKGTLEPMPGQSVDFDESQNVIIEGDNLEVLKLLQKSYYGKVKMIYIDPPYNTGNEFIYPDNFREGLEDYLIYSGQRSDDGTRQTSSEERAGRKHSKWLNMMYPRLFLARNLLKEDGTIFVSIDDNEVNNLKALMDEIYGQQNYVATITWKKRSGPPNDKIIGSVHEYVLIFAKDIEKADLQLMPRTEESVSRYVNPDEDSRGPWVAGDISANAKGGRYVESLYYEIVNPKTGQGHLPPEGACWRFSKARVEELIGDDRITFGSDGKGRPKVKRFLSEVRDGLTVPTIWDDIATNTNARSEINEIFGSNSVFETPKPTELIERMLQIATRDDDTVLDFFAGSGTTGHAVLKLNQQEEACRKFIMVQLPEPMEQMDIRSISQVTRERIKRVVQQFEKAENGKIEYSNTCKRGFKAFKLTESNFKVWDTEQTPRTLDALEKQINVFADNLASVDEQSVLHELILKSGLPLTVKIKLIDLGQIIYVVEGESFYICLANPIHESTLEAVIKAKPQRFLCLDVAFEGNDQLKTNTVLQMKSNDVDFKTA